MLAFLNLATTDLLEDVDWNHRLTGRQCGGQASLDMHVQVVLHLVGRVAAPSRAALVERCMLFVVVLHKLSYRKAVLSPHICFSLQHML